MCDRRASAAAGLADVAPPDVGEEVWRYSRIDELDLDRFSPSIVRPDAGISVDATLAGPAAATVILCDGWIEAVHVSDAAVEAGVSIGSVADMEDGADLHGAVLEAPVDLFGHLNRAFCPEPLAVVVPDGVRLDGPVVVVSHVVTEGVAAFPRLLVHCGADAEALVIEIGLSLKSTQILFAMRNGAFKWPKPKVRESFQSLSNPLGCLRLFKSTLN